MNRLILFILVFGSLVLSCANETSSANGEAGAQKKTNAQFVCQKGGGWTEMLPQYEVHLMLNEKDILVAVINSCELIPATDYLQYQVPEKALAACGGWWAGGGDYLYVVEEDKDINVYKGSQDEGQSDPGYGYKKIRTLSPGEY